MIWIIGATIMAIGELIEAIGYRKWGRVIFFSLLLVFFLAGLYCEIQYGS